MIIFIFVDGIGIGRRETSNPFYVGHFPYFEDLFSDHTTYLDPRMGVPGLPQSATGQTALFTGFNAAKIYGGHKEGFPGITLKNLLKEDSLFKKVQQFGYIPTFANAYLVSDPEALLSGHYISVTTYMTLTSVGTVRTLTDLNKNNAVFQDITNEMLLEGTFLPRYERFFPEINTIVEGDAFKKVSLRTPEEAAHALLSIAHENDVVLFEYFQTDDAGHKQDMDRALEVLSTLERFVKAIFTSVNPYKTTCILTSDHGNIEDLSVGTHTENKVPFIVLGKGKKYLRNITHIYDVTPAIVENIHFIL